jgi:Tripartite tricarboxylate transporter TctB family
MAENRSGGVSVDLKDVLSGLLMIAFAAGFAWLVLRPGGLALGSARSMGPGYFPLMVSMVLAGLGVIMVVTSFGRATGEVALVPLRSLVLVLLAPLVFAGIVQPFGFVAAISTTVMISAWASYRMTLKWALGTAAGMTIFCIVIFYYLLQMPITLWGDIGMAFFR